MCKGCPWANAETCRACKYRDKQSDGLRAGNAQAGSQAPAQKNEWRERGYYEG